ncbi:MAG: DUF6036 family nucleotidyltransferase [Candidatus Heimdallarchaeaceae archaeon]
MSENSPLTDGLRALVQYFEERKIPYVVVGGVAVLIYGRSRFTNDIDIIVDHEKVNREDFVEYLQSKRFDVRLEDLEGFDLKEHCTMFFSEYQFRVDLKGIYSESEKDAIENAVLTEFNDIKLRVANPISTIIFKLAFGSEQDYEDALAVYVRNMDKMDLKHLWHEAKKRGVHKELKKLIREVDNFLKQEKWEKSKK